MGTEIKKSENRVQIVGTLKEMNLQKTFEKGYKIMVNTSDEKTLDCNVISKKDFKNPTFVVEVNGQDIGVEFYDQSEQSIDYNTKELGDNRNYKALETVMDKYVTIMGAKEGETPTRVLINGQIALNEYATNGGSGDNYEIKRGLRVSGFSITSSNVPEADSSDAVISGVVRTISDEINPATEQETGRKKVEFYAFNNKGATFPIDLVVEEDIAQDFADYYEPMDCCSLYYEVKKAQTTQKKSSSGGGFGGRRDEKMVSGYVPTEYSIFKGSEKYEEENENFVSIEQMKEAMVEREIYFESLISKAKEKNSKESSKSTNSVKGSASKSGSSPFGNKTSSEKTEKKASSPF